ncbi:hypothetical protein [Winogradskyella ursingii]|uniref:hypothetical protein n=1 Tax=Winogradskyella ursingii TaxID=2686079 RepID=UPI0015CE46A8|nr:hypothetical protein [Winogradskyella ursingii]
MNSEIIVSENDRPIWQMPIAALFFSAATLIILLALYKLEFTEKGLIIFLHRLEPSIALASIGVGFTLTKSIHIDIKSSKFKPTLAVGPLKFGTWKTIKNYEYVSVFHQPLKDGSYIFEVNLWYDNNKHFNLYEKDNYKDAFLIGYDLSEELNIDLLDATVPNDFKWIDKEEWKTKINEVSTK